MPDDLRHPSPVTEADSDARREARRDFEICNACRYCEGYCAVFPAMGLRQGNSPRRTSRTLPTSATAARAATTPANTRRRIPSP